MITNKVYINFTERDIFKIHGKYCYESDMWSIGVIMYVLVTVHQPFKGKDKDKVSNA